MKRYSLYLFILINLLFSSIENEITSAMAKYGYPLAEDYFFENMNNSLSEKLTKNINSVLHRDNFLVKIDLQIENYFIYDSTVVTEGFDGWGVIDDYFSTNSSSCEINNTQKLVCLKNNTDFFLYLFYIPKVTILVDSSINIDGLELVLRDLVTKSLNRKVIDYSICNDILEIKSVNIHDYKSNSPNQLYLNRDDIYDDSWAVIIGINKYENLSNLDYAVDDAEAVKEMLINKFDYSKENVKLLLNEDANKTNIVNVISDVSLKAGENDRILVFYAGHGETMQLPEGGEMGYLVPIDGNQENLFASAIPMDDLKRLSNMSKAKHMLFLVDACYGGLAAVGSRGLEPTKTPDYIEKIINIKSRQIITAGGKDEEVFEKSEWGHSAYTKNLLSALEGGLADSNSDGYITADELGDYLSEKVSIDSENQQTPQSRRLTSHEGEFVFFNDKTIKNSSVNRDVKDRKYEELLKQNALLEKKIKYLEGLKMIDGSYYYNDEN